MATTPANKALNDTGPNGWAEYRRLVLSEIERISTALAKCEGQTNAFHLALSQAISDSRQNLLDKLHELAQHLETDYDKKIEETEKDTNRRIEEVKKDGDKKIDGLKEDHEKRLKDLDKKSDKQSTDIATLKAKAIMLGATAGFVVALVGLFASLFLKK
jgi:DNA anti-recombination protein RmuC